MQPKDMIGLLSTSNAAVGKSWAEICNEGQCERDAWVAALKEHGIVAAHPDDGWVDRVKNQIRFAYPQFNLGVEVGSLVALGWPDKHRVVRITGTVESMLSGRAWTFSEDIS